MSEIRRNCDRLALVVLCWENVDDTIACLDSILNSSSPPDTVVVVDNGSTSSTQERLEAEISLRIGKSTQVAGRDIGLPGTFRVKQWAGQHWFLILSPQNLGYAAGNNVGLSVAVRLEARWLWVLNNDTRLMSEAIGRLRRWLEQESAPGLWGTIVVEGPNQDVIQCVGGGRFSWVLGRNEFVGRGKRWPLPPDELQALALRVDYPSGASLVMDRDLYRMLGGFDERFRHYCEEMDLTIRGRAHGVSLAIASDVVVWHKMGAALGSARSFFRRAPRSFEYATESVIKLVAWHRGRWLSTVIVSRMVMAFVLALAGRSVAARAVIRGLASGLRSSRAKYQLSRQGDRSASG